MHEHKELVAQIARAGRLSCKLANQIPGTKILALYITRVDDHDVVSCVVDKHLSADEIVFALESAQQMVRMPTREVNAESPNEEMRFYEVVPEEETPKSKVQQTEPIHRVSGKKGQC